MDQDRPAKRMRRDEDNIDRTTLRARRTVFLDSLCKPVSPPPGQSPKPGTSSQQSGLMSTRTKGYHPVSPVEKKVTNDATRSEKAPVIAESPPNSRTLSSTSTQCIPSPIKLTKIKGLPTSENMDTVDLHSILGDPLIKEIWIFNFCFDVDWLMRHVDVDVRDSVQVKIVHGSWRREDMNKILIDEACSRRSNVTPIQAYLPDAFGTHHSKMFILFRHDNLAQVIIHTANMLEKDWSNLTQAVWQSPLLPLVKDNAQQDSNSDIGNQFKNDLLCYLKAYGGKLKPLMQQLQLYSFEGVRAALVASVPSKFKVSAADQEVWGHEMLRRKIDKAGLPPREQKSKPHFVYQVSSIASLPSTWLKDTLFSANKATKDTTSIIYPTAPDVAKSLDGYAAGGSIHTKAQSAAHLKQISELKSQLCRWTAASTPTNQSGRDLAAPHIKTYIRFSSKPTPDHPRPDIDWALMTSANLSTQAWGSAPKLAKGDKDPSNAVIHIQSYEIGVLVWPALFQKSGDDEVATVKCSARIVPVFKKDVPSSDGVDGTLVGLRMPYDLPLTPYQSDEMPWSPQASYDAPDRHGVVWR